MKVGIPRALIYYFFEDLWKEFFATLKVDTIVSPPTNKDIIRRGMTNSIDEACFSSKIFLGHVDWLRDKCDLVFVPRVECTGIREEYCTRLFGVYDLVRNTFPDVKWLHADTNILMRRREPDAYTKIGEALGFDGATALAAYNKALAEATRKKQEVIVKQETMLAGKGVKVLIASHAYNTHDAVIGKPVVDYFNNHGINVAFADVIDVKEAKEKAKEVYGKRIYWRINMEIIGGVLKYKDQADGIVLISTFPCGPDGITNEMIIRTVKDKPILNIMVDELSADAGLATRLESFTDILGASK
ncbi:MAG: acyl-CoA dehydratase activase-related protein [Firmicutes bacterium]|nr:acyl-CoA dehydratase activase-related protein [Bacillota bacterium]